MKTLGNLFWLLFGGLFWGIGNIIVGAVVCITIIGIPYGLQLIKIGRFVIWPFGKEVVATNKVGPFRLLGNILWVILFGLIEAIGYLITGLLLCITIVGFLLDFNILNLQDLFYYHLALISVNLLNLLYRNP